MTAERAYVTGMSSLVTAEALLRTNILDKRTELVRGQLIVREPAGAVLPGFTCFLGSIL